MSLSRRQFIKSSLVAGGALSLGFSLTGCRSGEFPTANPSDFQPNAFLQLTPENELILQVHKVEMGQGTMTGFSTLIAEELDIDPRRITAQLSGIHRDYADPYMQIQATGGSTSMKVSYQPLREAAAAMREMLKDAAAKQLGWPREQVVIRDGGAFNSATGDQVQLSELIKTAQQLPVPGKVSLKPEQEFKYIGKYGARVDAQAKVDGTADFCIDLDIPGALSAVVVRSPRRGAKAASVDDKAALAVKGVQRVLEIDSGIAVVAETYWQARKAAGELKISWSENELSGVSSESILEQQRKMLDAGDKNEVTAVGNYAKLQNVEVIEAEYSVPYLAHATMEPLNAIASVTDEKIEIWAGNQAPDVVRSVVAETLGRPREQITVNTIIMGGGFGRRIVPDFSAEAAAISAEVKAPIKLVWSREDDTQNDYYRPSMLSKLSAAFSTDGKLVGWSNHIVGPSLSANLMPVFGGAAMPQWVPHALPKAVGQMMEGTDFSSVEGADKLPYAIDNIDVRYSPYDPGLPIGYWRSVGHSQNAFFVESFVDEVANRLGEDPADFRRQRLKGQPKHLKVLETVLKQAKWGQPEAGYVQGLAVHESFGSVVGQVAELKVENGQPVIRKITCVIDCGRVVNPDVVVMQMESGIVFGLTAALKGEITLKDGEVQQSNFHDYPLLRMNEVPDIEVVLIDSEAPPEGVGEPGVPPVAPAVSNALFAATGKRLRKLPLRLHEAG